MTGYHPRGEELHVQAGGLTHRVLRYGTPDRPDVLLLPGITSTALALDFVAHALRDAFRVHVPDIRGRGGTVAPAGGGYTLREYAADVVALCTALSLQRPALLGHSMGARIAAAAAPHLAHGPLVLVDPPLSGPGRPYPTSAAAFAEQLAEANAGTTAAAVARWYPHWPERERAIRAQELPRCDETAVAATHHGFETEEFAPYWSTLRAPVTLVRGEQSPVVTAEDVPQLRRLNPHARLVDVPGAGHMVPWDNLDGFLTAARTALNSPAQHATSPPHPTTEPSVPAAQDPPATTGHPTPGRQP